MNQNNQNNQNNLNVNNQKNLNANNPNNQNNEQEPKYPSFGEEKSIVDESFSVDFADAYEKEMLSSKIDVNETILEQKLKKINQKNNNPQANNNPNINTITDISFCILNHDDFKDLIQNKKKEDYLEVRKLPPLVEKEYLNIKKSVSRTILQIQNYLIKLKMDYTQFNPSKKVGPLMPLTYIIENNFLFKRENRNQMQECYEKYKNYIYNFRTIYGDGNCYYRAVIFRYIELLILYKKVDIIKALIIDIHKSFESKEIKRRLVIGRDYLNPQLILQIMITIVELVQNNKIVEAHLAFYKGLLFSKIFDY